MRSAGGSVLAQVHQQSPLDLTIFGRGSQCQKVEVDQTGDYAGREHFTRKGGCRFPLPVESRLGTALLFLYL
jgi:hypothetical protein